MAKNDFPFPFSDASPDIVAAHDELLDDMSELGANCLGIIPSPWMDYGDEDEPFAEPSAVDAVMMCSGCPVIESCFMYARLSKPIHGVWGGVKWRNRREKKQ